MTKCKVFLTLFSITVIAGFIWISAANADTERCSDPLIVEGYIIAAPKKCKCPKAGAGETLVKTLSHCTYNHTENKCVGICSYKSGGQIAEKDCIRNP